MMQSLTSLVALSSNGPVSSIFPCKAWVARLEFTSEGSNHRQQWWCFRGMAVAGFSTPTSPRDHTILIYFCSVVDLHGTYDVDGVKLVNAHTGKLEFQNQQHVAPWHGTI